MYKVVWFARYAPDRPKPASDRHWAASQDSPNVFDESRMWGAALREVVVKDS